MDGKSTTLNGPHREEGRASRKSKHSHASSTALRNISYITAGCRCFQTSHTPSLSSTCRISASASGAASFWLLICRRAHAVSSRCFVPPGLGGSWVVIRGVTGSQKGAIRKVYLTYNTTLSLLSSHEAPSNPLVPLP